MNQYQQDHGNAPEQVKGRFLVFVIILILMFAYLFVGLVNLQLKSSEGYSTKTESTRLKTIPLTGKRGNITDANSVILATDEMVYNVTFYKDASESSSSVYKTYTQSIIDTLEIIERNGGKLAFSYVIQRSEETGEWEFNFGSGVSDATLQTRESQWRSNNYVTTKSYPTPEDCLVTLKHRYRMVNSAEEEEEVRAAYIEKRGDDSGYVPCIIVDEDTMLKVMAVFSEMQMNLYNSLPITIAKNVSFETVTEIETKSMMLPGMDISESTQRVYPKQTLAAQVIGYIGKIPSRTMWLTLQAKGYSYNDTIGRDGIESSMEDWLTQNSSLRKGSRVVERNNWSKIVREISYTEPSDGNNVKLTLDVNYQTVAERAIASNVARIRDKQEDLMVSSKWLEDNRTLIATYDWEHYPLELAEHGVMLVLDMQARVLAMANYPTYDLNALVAGGDEARAILSDDRNLMLNYAIGSRATPGSIFKMVTGFGALDSGVLKPDEMISDMGYYTAYNSDLSTAPKCWISEGYRSQHYYQTIVGGLEHSCNYFFYECGSRLGETRLYQYAAAFGLTSKTGIDLPGEVRSVVGSQNTLYDPTKPVGESSQDTSRPIIVFNSIKSHLKKCGESRGMEYDDERLSSCAKRLMDMAVAYPESSWVENMRTILMEELNMPRSMVYSNSVITDTYNYINDIKWGGSQTILTAIGQSVTTVTPIAVARYVTAVANGGKVYNVSIVDSIISPEGEVLSRRDPVLINDLNDTNGYFNLIHKGMKGVTDDTGTAKRYWSDFKQKWKDEMGAKTGTAQVNQIDLENNGWFVCFAPLDNPKVAIVVYVPHGYSGAMCSYAAKDFLNWIFPEWDKSDVDYDLPIGNSLAP